MKTALITGGTSGIGASIAKGLVPKDYKVILIGSNLEKGQTIESELNAQYPQGAQFIQLDLSNMNDVKKFSKQFLESHSKLDVLANIAGIVFPKRNVTNEGFERTFAIGYLSAYILSTLLAPLLENAPNGRIINVSGSGKPSHFTKRKLDFDNLDFSKNYSGPQAAITTVHAKTILTEILSEKYASRGIDVHSFSPGLVRSNLLYDMPLWMRIIEKLFYPIFYKESCETGIYVCSSSDIQGITGKFFDKKTALPLKFKKSDRDRLWQESENLIGRV